MKATRKLIPAIAMLLISAVMMSTATFAWFSTNSTVTATGFKVSAQSSSTYLVIGNDKAAVTADGYTAITTTATSTNPQLIPVWFNATNNNWYTGTGTDEDDGTLKGDLSKIDSPVPNTHYFTQTLYIRVADRFSNAEDLRLEAVTISDQAGAKSDVLSVVVKVGEVYNSYTYTETEVDGNKTYVHTLDNTASLDDVISTNPKEVVEVTVYVYIDGFAADTTTQNVLSDLLKDLSVDLTFAVGPRTQG